eukprot:c22727_g1_i1 orf=183-1607(+)
MDGYLYNRDSYSISSAGYYAPSYPPSYGLERRSAYGPPLSDSLASYSRLPIDPYSGYGAPSSYQPEVVLRPRYASSAPDPPAFRSRPRPGPKKKPPPPPPQNLGPRKKPFKQTQKVRFSEENGRFSKKAVQMKPLQAGKRADKPDTRTGKAPSSQASSLVKETQELHSLYRTGIDSKIDRKFENKKDDRKAASMKRKAETQMQKSTPVKEVDESAKKKQKQKKNKKFAKDKESKKQADSSPVVEKAAKATPPPLTEEEAKAALELQRGMSKSVGEFLGVAPVVEEPGSKEAVDVSESDAKPEDNKDGEKPSKPEEPQRTPEEEKELEEKSFNFFSKMFEDHEDLRNLYIDKCNSGSFECLVCHSIDARRSKKFWNLVSLVMHTTMRKQMRPEHRGYGRAVSAVLGWDPMKTPRVPHGSKHIPTVDKTTEVKEDIKPETEDKTVDEEVKVTDVNVPGEHQEENATEDPSKDSIEE